MEFDADLSPLGYFRQCFSLHKANNFFYTILIFFFKSNLFFIFLNNSTGYIFFTVKKNPRQSMSKNTAQVSTYKACKVINNMNYIAVI